MRLLRNGNANRATEATKANSESSRSHAVLQIFINKVPKAGGFKYTALSGKLSMIDLAGSERGTVTENRGLRLREGAKINRSLLALANCINALGDKSKKGTFVPYRDSKLTRLLKDSLGGNSKTLMMCNVSTASTQFEETINTLKYAARAKKIKTRPVENKRMVELHIVEYKHIIEGLKKEVQDLRSKDVVFDRPGDFQAGRDTCVDCGLNIRKPNPEVKEQINELTEMFQEQLNLRKAICEIEVQNRMNRLDIIKERELAKTGVLEVNMINLEISNLESSVDFNSTMQLDVKARLQKNIEDTEDQLNQIQKTMHSEDNHLILEELVKNKMIELENLETEGNLQMYEQVNNMLMKQIKQMQDKLTENGVDFNLYTDEEEEDEELYYGDDLEAEEEDEGPQDMLQSLEDEDEIEYRNRNKKVDMMEDDNNGDYSYENHGSKGFKLPKISKEITKEKIKDNSHHQNKEQLKSPFLSQKDGNFLKRGNSKEEKADHYQEDDQETLLDYTKTIKGYDDSQIQQIQQRNERTPSFNKKTFDEENNKNDENENTTGNHQNPLDNENDYSNVQMVDDMNDTFDRQLKEQEIRELEEIGFDMAAYQGTIIGGEDNLYNTQQDQLEQHYMITQAEVNNEIKRLETMPNIEVERGAHSNLERSSTMRLDRDKNKTGVDWNLVSNWGEEWTIYEGGIYPETIVTLEGDLTIRTKDFESMLTEQEMKLLRNLEVGEDLEGFDDIAEDEFETFDEEF